MNLLLRSSCLVALVSLICVLPGCGDKGPSVTLVEGRLLDNGAPYRVTKVPNLPPGELGFMLTFVYLLPTGPTEQNGAIVNEDGTFRVGGNKDKGIPPGKYRIVLHKGAFGNPDEFKGAFSLESSKLEVTIPTAKSVKVDVDIGKKTAVIVP